MRVRHAGWCLVVVAMLALTAPAWAHVDVPSAPDVPPLVVGVEALTAAGPSMDRLWLLVTAVALAAVAVARRRRAVALACTALLLLVAFEAGVHSVHHVGDHLGGQCVVASASAHTGGVAVDAVAFEAPVEVAAAVAVTRTAASVVRSVAPHLGRAPPSA